MPGGRVVNGRKHIGGRHRKKGTAAQQLGGRIRLQSGGARPERAWMDEGRAMKAFPMSGNTEH